MGKISRLWFVFLIFTTLVSGFVYIVVQQEYRHAADDPQIAMAHDLAVSLNNGKAFTTSQTVDIANTHSAFTTLFDSNGHVTVSEGRLHNQDPKLPQGVFAYTKEHGQDRFTWQPENNVRIAAIVEQYSHGYILVGRSLEESEKREMQLEQHVFVFWILSNIIMLAAITCVMYKHKK